MGCGAAFAPGVLTVKPSGGCGGVDERVSAEPVVFLPGRGAPVSGAVRPGGKFVTSGLSP